MAEVAPNLPKHDRTKDDAEVGEACYVNRSKEASQEGPTKVATSYQSLTPFSNEQSMIGNLILRRRQSSTSP